MPHMVLVESYFKIVKFIKQLLMLYHKCCLHQYNLECLNILYKNLCVERVKVVLKKKSLDLFDAMNGKNPQNSHLWSISECEESSQMIAME